MKELFLHTRLEKRRAENALRKLGRPPGQVDFSSNDYLGIVRNKRLAMDLDGECSNSGSTGSRLLTGNSALIEDLETKIARFHDAAAGLIFTSGFEANTGLMASVASRGDTIIYDYLSHASIRDGIRLSLAESFSFRHNDPEDLRRRLQSARGNIFVVVESVYSMDGDFSPLLEISRLCAEFNANLIVDEAHATGVIGEKGEGLVQVLRLQNQCFARIHTFGKACGAMGAIVLGSVMLRDFLVNFSRPFIYTTALPEWNLRAIDLSYELFPALTAERLHLQHLIKLFREFDLPYNKAESETAIQAVIIPGNERVKNIASALQAKGLDVRPILYPSVPQGSERLRVVFHAFNTANEVQQLAQALIHGISPITNQ